MANALESASLVMIPSGYEDGTLGSLKPTDGSGDFTFSRGSDISATRVNADGYIEKGYENTIIGSNDFARDNSSYLITNGEAGYDGTNDAWLVNKLAAAYFSKDALVLTGVMTISFYAKAGSLDRIFVFIGGQAARFDLTNGTAAKAGGTPIAQTIELVSGTTDWYRCSITINKSVTTNLLLKPQNSSNQDVVGTIYIQDAMLNQGLVAYPYKETTTAPVAGGILEDMPRLDYSNGSCPNLKLEPQRTNGFNYSEALYQLPVKSGVSWEDNVTTSPEGLNNAGKLTEGTGFQYLAQSGFQSGNRVLSVFAKYDNSLTRICLGQYITTNQVANAVFNIQAGTILSETTGSSNIMILEDAGVEDYGNGWRRYWVSISGNSGVAYVGPSGSDTISFIPNYTGSSQHCFLYGLQYEQDATYPTSYIPTYGVSQTRLADVCDRGSNLAYTGDYTLFMEFELTKDSVYFLSNGSFGYRLFIETDDAYFKFGSSNVFFQNMFDWRAALGTNIKMAIYKNGTDAAMFVNGTKYTPSLNTLSTGNEVLDWRYLNYTTTTDRQKQAYIKQLVEFQTALSDDECIELTTI